MLGGATGAVGSRDLAGEEAPGTQQAIVTHLSCSLSCCFWTRQKGLLGHLFSLCLHGAPLEFSCSFRKPQEKRFPSTRVLCFARCSAYLKALPAVCTEECWLVRMPTPDHGLGPKQRGKSVLGHSGLK